jgi:hypothetical protein
MTILQGDDFAVRRLHSVAEVDEAPSGAEIRSGREDGFTPESKSTGHESRRAARGGVTATGADAKELAGICGEPAARACREVGPAVAADQIARRARPRWRAGAVQFLSLDNNSVTPV